MSRSIHSMHGTPFYIAWCNMKSRCNNPQNRSYKDYGNRGIWVCEEWNTFSKFMEDMLPSYKEGLTLERINVDGNYCKANCTWVSRYEQSINRRNTKFIEYQGDKKTLTDWAKHLGKKRSTLAQRYYVYGWTIEETLLGK